MGEQISLHLIHGAAIVAAWRRTSCPPWQADRVHLGCLPDGRWYAHHTGSGAWAYHTETQARAAAERMRGDGQWETTEPDPTGADYRRRGYVRGPEGGWVRPDA